MISWQQSASTVDATHPLTPPTACSHRSEEWARRTASLRSLLRERDAEVVQLQGLLDERGRQLAGREAEAAQQAQRIAALEQRIRALLGQLEAAHAAAAAAAGAADRGEDGWMGGVCSRKLACGWCPEFVCTLPHQNQLLSDQPFLPCPLPFRRADRHQQQPLRRAAAAAEEPAGGGVPAARAASRRQLLCASARPVVPGAPGLRLLGGAAGRPAAAPLALGRCRGSPAAAPAHHPVRHAHPGGAAAGRAPAVYGSTHGGCCRRQLGRLDGAAGQAGPGGMDGLPPGRLGPAGARGGAHPAAAHSGGRGGGGRRVWRLSTQLQPGPSGGVPGGSAAPGGGLRLGARGGGLGPRVAAVCLGRRLGSLHGGGGRHPRPLRPLPQAGGWHRLHAAAGARHGRCARQSGCGQGRGGCERRHRRRLGQRQQPGAAVCGQRHRHWL